MGWWTAVPCRRYDAWRVVQWEKIKLFAGWVAAPTNHSASVDLKIFFLGRFVLSVRVRFLFHRYFLFVCFRKTRNWWTTWYQETKYGTVSYKHFIQLFCTWIDVLMNLMTLTQLRVPRPSRSILGPITSMFVKTVGSILKKSQVNNVQCQALLTVRRETRWQLKNSIKDFKLGKFFLKILKGVRDAKNGMETIRGCIFKYRVVQKFADKLQPHMGED